MNGFGLFNQEKCWYNGDVAKNIVTWGKTIDGWKHIIYDVERFVDTAEVILEFLKRTINAMGFSPLTIEILSMNNGYGCVWKL